VISVAARLAGLPSWFLRVLDDEGIVVPVRTESNRRLYSEDDVTLLARVRELTADPPEGRGVNLAGVKVILEMERGRGSRAAAPAGDPRLMVAPAALGALPPSAAADGGDR
jgi:DNA-binding transcriptional MerR regulator